MESNPDSGKAWLNIALTALITLYYTVKMVIFYTLYVTMYIFQLAIWPFSLLLKFLLIVFAPFIYLAQLTFAPFSYFASMLPRLQPLYIYFGSAACIGIFAGLLLQLTSSTIVSILGLHLDSSSHQHGEEATRNRLKFDEEEEDENFRPGTADSFKTLSDFSSAESDWRWNSNTKRKRKSPGLLLSQTILEEDDDSI